jgi:hypothetical protein
MLQYNCPKERGKPLLTKVPKDGRQWGLCSTEGVGLFLLRSIQGPQNLENFVDNFKTQIFRPSKFRKRLRKLG